MKKNKTIDMRLFEKKFISKGTKYIAGIDEVGRGCWAGPLCVATCILPNDYNNDKIDDSKKVSAITRKKLSDEIKKIAIDYKIIFVDSATIDKEGNIKSTTIKTMKKIVKMLDPIPDVVLVDAENIEEADAPKSESIIKGDGKSISIAAASILAKVARDEYMVEVLDKQYPQFYFKNNKGYGTKQHIDALKKNKPIPGIHRFSYEPIKKLVE